MAALQALRPVGSGPSVARTAQTGPVLGSGSSPMAAARAVPQTCPDLGEEACSQAPLEGSPRGCGEGDLSEPPLQAGLPELEGDLAVVGIAAKQAEHPAADPIGDKVRPLVRRVDAREAQLVHAVLDLLLAGPGAEVRGDVMVGAEEVADRNEVVLALEVVQDPEKVTYESRSRVPFLEPVREDHVVRGQEDDASAPSWSLAPG